MQRFSILKKFNENILNLDSNIENKKIAIAVSGGADSRGLLELFLEIFPKHKPLVLHFNHNLRIEATAEENIVKNVTLTKGLKFYTKKKDVYEIAKQRKRGVEEAARWARYNFFSEAKEKFNLDYIITGHHADDQLESVLMALVKGTGVSGLKGIPQKRDIYLRPLLNISKEEIKNYLNGKNIIWLEDKSNYETLYLRNKLRLEISSKLKEYNKQILNNIFKLTSIVEEEELFWQKHLKELNKKLIINESKYLIEINKNFFLSLSLAEKRRVLYSNYWALWKGAEISLNEIPNYYTVDNSLNYMEKNKQKGIDLPGGLRVELKKEKIILTFASRFKTRK